jgi:hypothetical protein
VILYADKLAGAGFDLQLRGTQGEAAGGRAAGVRLHAVGVHHEGLEPRGVQPGDEIRGGGGLGAARDDGGPALGHGQAAAGLDRAELEDPGERAGGGVLVGRHVMQYDGQHVIDRAPRGTPRQGA